MRSFHRGRAVAGGRRAARTGAPAQSTVEYAVVLAVLIAIFAACMLLVHAAEDGTLAGIVEDAASHGMAGLGWVDIALY